jgi:TP901 family phage tail tape measure protein
MEQVSSIIATVSSVTRESAESIGTSYKTIFARIGDLKLGGVDEDGVGLGQVSSQLDAIGVKILDESGNLREMGDIIIDLGTKWQTMNQAQKTAVAQVVAGKRQYTQLMALFENWDMFQNNMNIAENSEGALQDMADIYAESWEAASARV